MQYKNTFGKIQVMKNEHLFRGKTLGVSMSGGADSTMLCYLLAKTIKKRDLQITIQPYNGYDIWAPLDSRGIIKIVQYIQSTFPTVDIQWPISTVFDTNGASASEGDKNSYIRPLIDKQCSRLSNKWCIIRTPNGSTRITIWASSYYPTTGISFMGRN